MKRWRQLALLVLAVCSAAFSCPSQGLAWELLRSENDDVRRGSELLKQGKHEEATQAFETAARSLPQEPGVHLNRGLALLSGGKLAEAREAFRKATEGQASPSVRADAQYNMGLAFMCEADAAAQGEQLEEAQKFLREAVDAFKSSLRSAPKNRDAAWNLEVAKRRLVDLDQKKKQQDEQQKQKEQPKQQDEQQKSDEPNEQDGQQNQDPQDDGQQGDPQKSQQDAPSESKQDADPQGQPPPEGGNQQDSPQGEGPREPPKPDAAEGQKPDPTKEPSEQPEAQQPSAPEQAPPDGTAQQLPEHMQRALDALSEGDENLQKHRARVRSRQRPQRIEKDW